MKKQKYSVHNENLLFSTGNSTQCSVVTETRRKSIYVWIYVSVYGICICIWDICICIWDICICIADSLCYTVETNNIVT